MANLSNLLGSNFIGASGYSGISGYSGQDGVIGSNGASGYSGISGYSGATGQFGGASFYYIFDTKTNTLDPGQGRLNVNSATFSTATTLTIHDDDRFFSNISSFLQTIDDSTSDVKGFAKITEEGNTVNFVIFGIVGLHTEDTNHFDVPISYISGQTGSFSNNTNVVISFTVTGDKGDPGTSGYSGYSGYSGISGYSGYSGISGYSGYSGISGYSGYSGATLTGIPQNSQTNAYTLQLSDAGKHISITTGGVTVPNNIFSAGDTVVVFNNSNGTQIVTQGVNVTLRWGGSTSTGNRNVASYGVATILCYAANNFVLTGAGIT